MKEAFSMTLVHDPAYNSEVSPHKTRSQRVTQNNFESEATLFPTKVNFNKTLNTYQVAKRRSNILNSHENSTQNSPLRSPLRSPRKSIRKPSRSFILDRTQT